MAYRDTLCTNFIIKSKPQREYGKEAPSKLVEAEKGRSAIYVMSGSAFEQEEVDYLVEASQYKEDERIKKNIKSEQKERLEQVVEATRQAPPGKRAETAHRIIKEVGR